jgi:polysaccharide export outer membrane protein
LNLGLPDHTGAPIGAPVFCPPDPCPMPTPFRIVLSRLALLFCLGFIGLLSAADSVPAIGTAPAPAGYRLYPGDLLRIDVFDHPDLSAIIRVPSSGTLAFPLVGDIPNQVGRPLETVRSELKTRLERDYIRKAVITITVTEFGKRQVYVMGNVEKAGAIDLNPFLPTSAMQAIGQAGGFKDDANRAAALVIRDDPDRPGAKLGLPVPAQARPEDLGSDIRLEPGDLVVVPALDRAYVIGQVAKSGSIDLPAQSQVTVSKAVSLAGGFTRFARESEVQLIRAGQPVRSVDVHSLLTGNAKVEDPVLKPGDTVFVPESRF